MKDKYFTTKQHEEFYSELCATYKVIKNKSECIDILCIGTDRSTGDCLAPLVGNMLKGLLPNNINVLGTLKAPVHAKNLYKYYESNNTIIAIDGALGSLKNVKRINVSEGALYPGSGVGKELEPIGDMNITGIVNVGGHLEYLVLQSTRLSVVMEMAEFISNAIMRLFKVEN